MKTERHPLFTPPILVIDLEATCDDGDGLPAAEMEIIEIGAVWATADGEVLDSFEALIRPVVHPVSASAIVISRGGRIKTWTGFMP